MNTQSNQLGHISGLGYPGWVVGVFPDVAEHAAHLEKGGASSEISFFTVDGEEYRPRTFDGLAAILPPGRERVLEVVDKVKAKYDDPIIFVIAVLYEKESGVAVDSPNVVPVPPVVLYPSDLVPMEEAEAKGSTFVSCRDVWPNGGPALVEAGDGRRMEYVRPGGAMSGGLASRISHVTRRPVRNNSTMFTFPPVLRAARLEPVRPQAGPRRNEACPCGSGRKFKACCMRKR